MFYGHVAHKFVVMWDSLCSCFDVWVMEVGDAGWSDAGGDDAGGSDAWGRASMSKQGANASGVGGKLSRHQRRVNVFCLMRTSKQNFRKFQQTQRRRQASHGVFSSSIKPCNIAIKAMNETLSTLSPNDFSKTRQCLFKRRNS